MPPFAFNDDKGDLVGFDIDIARLAAKALFKRSDQDRVRERDRRGPVARHRERSRRHGRRRHDDLSRPRHPGRVHAPLHRFGHLDLVSKKSGIKIAADSNQDKFTVANLNNPQMADRAKRLLSQGQGPDLRYARPAQFLAVRSGRAQALQIDTPSADYWAAQRQGRDGVATRLLTASQNNGIFLKPGDFKWWLWLDTTVAELRTGSWYPQYSEIYQKWFGKNPPPQKFYLPQ